MEYSDGNFRLCQEHGFCALLFDWDGVLVDSAKNYYRAYELVLRDVGVETAPREIYLREGQPTGKVIAAILERHGQVVDSSKIQELVERRRSYDLALGQRQLFDGVLTLIARLRAANLKVGMVTGSSRKSIEFALSGDLAKAFDVVITADDVQRPKPDPQPFLLAASRLDVPPAHCLVIENAPFGIQGARAAGCGVVGLCTTLLPEDLNQADWIALDHQELESILHEGDRGRRNSGGI